MKAISNGTLIMKKFAKNTLFIFLSFIIFTQILDLIGWLTDDEPVEKDALTKIEKINPSENGYEFIKFMDEPNFRLLNESFDNKILKNLLINEQWNDIEVKKVLDNHLKYQNIISEVNSKPFFQSKIIESYLHSFSAYFRYSELLSLKLIESRSYAENNDINKAIKSTEQALIFSQRLKANMSPTLISFLTGLSHQDQILSWLHKLATAYNTNDDQLTALLTLTNTVSDYIDDNFDAVISGEFYFSELIRNEMFNFSSLNQRFDLLQITSYGSDEKTVSEVIYNFLTFLSPHYFFQTQKNSNAMYLYRTKDSESVRTSCKSISYSHYPNEVKNHSFFNTFKLNAAGSSFTSQSSVSFKKYFLRRCQADFHLQAVKAAIAITLFESKNNREIQKLESLVPTIIKNPLVDATTNEGLRFNPEKRWLYSQGINFSDNNGSLETIYNSSCHHSTACQNNPTVPIAHVTTPQYTHE